MTKETQQTQRKEKKKGPVRRAIGAAYSFLGFKDIVDGVGKQAENLTEAGQRAKSLYQSYRDAIFKKREARTESFEEAVARLSLTRKGLEERRKELATASYIFMVVFASTLYFLIDALLESRIVNAFTLLTLTMTIGALIFSFRFRVWQIEKRRLGGPKEYIGHLLGRS